MRRSKRAWSVIAVFFASILILVLGAQLLAPTFLPWNTQASLSEFKAMLDTETAKRWQGRVDLVSVESTSEKWESDFPVSSGTRTAYLAWFQITGTDARFVVPFPPDAEPEQLRDWGMFSSELSPQEVDALVAYARTGGEPPVLLFGGDPASSQDSSTGTAWSVTPLDRDGMNLCGPEVTLIIKPNGDVEIRE